MFITPSEILDMAIMTAILGYIFMDMFKRPMHDYNPIEYLKNKKKSDFWFAVAVTAPAVILHELGHKFVALSFGLEATFHAAYSWLIMGVLLKIILGFVFFIPGYVTHQGFATPLQHSLIAFAGPLLNLILWQGSIFALKNKMLPKKHDALLFMTSRINMFLFFFNMIPIPPFDGYTVFWGIVKNFIG